MPSEEQFSLKDIFPGRNEEEPVEYVAETTNTITTSDEVTTSYLLVNVLLNLLISKGIIRQHEVDSLLLELHAEYRKAKKE